MLGSASDSVDYSRLRHVLAADCNDPMYAFKRMWQNKLVLIFLGLFLRRRLASSDI